MHIDTRVGISAKLDLSGSVAPAALQIPEMPAEVWRKGDLLRSQFHLKSREFFECESVLAVTGIESGITALARLFQTWYGSMRVVLAEPCFDQWDVRFRRASHVVLDWPVDLILEGEIPECDVVVLGRPVNPTSQMVSIDVAKKLAKRLRAEGGWLILDEAYIDWSGEESYTSFIEDMPAIVLRSMAPFTGLSGANLAFVCGTKAVCQALLEEVGTQAVSAAQWWLALEYFKSERWRQTQMDELTKGVLRLKSVWSTRLGNNTELIPGGYFLSFVHPDCGKWAHHLELQGILVRLYSGEDDIIRCAIPRDEESWNRLSLAVAGLP